MYELPLLFVSLLLAGVLVYLYARYRALRERLESTLFSKQSQSVKYGQLSEQWIPLSQHVPFNPEDFRFLGAPVDGVAFTDKKILFCEFKTNDAKLSERQKKIKKQVKQGKVEWLEVGMK